jgi:predicted RND superfamily exporter protein
MDNQKYLANLGTVIRWSLIALVSIYLVGLINAYFDPDAMKQVEETRRHIKQMQEEREFNEQFGKSSSVLKTMEPAPCVDEKYCNKLDRSDKSGNLFAAQKQVGISQ